MITDDVHEAIRSVDDPEYPGVSIADLGLVERIAVGDDGAVYIGLIPTFSGCPALAMIGTDVERAVGAVPGVGSVEVEWLTSPAWSTERVTADARQLLGNEFTVAVELGGTATRCPRCGAETTETSMFGPSRCRAVHTCPSCSETIEVMRG